MPEQCGPVRNHRGLLKRILAAAAALLWPGSLTLARGPSLWEGHRGFVFIVIGTVVILVGLIIALIFLYRRLKQEHQSLSLREARLTALLDSTSAAICSRDKNDALLIWNKAFAASIKTLFGVEPYIGLLTGDLVPPEQREQFSRFHKISEKVYKGESFNRIWGQASYVRSMPGIRKSYFEIV